MSGQALRLLDEALQLPEEDRAELALRLLDSVGEPANQVERAWIDEAKRRLAAIERGREDRSLVRSAQAHLRALRARPVALSVELDPQAEQEAQAAFLWYLERMAVR